MSHTEFWTKQIEEWKRLHLNQSFNFDLLNADDL